MPSALRQPAAVSVHILAALPACTFDQSRFWRYQFADCASQLADDAERWGVQLTPTQWFTEFTTPFPLPPRP